MAPKLCHLKKSSWNHDWELTHIYPKPIKKRHKIMIINHSNWGWGANTLCFAIYKAFSLSYSIFITTPWSRESCDDSQFLRWEFPGTQRGRGACSRVTANETQHWHLHPDLGLQVLFFSSTTCVRSRAKDKRPSYTKTPLHARCHSSNAGPWCLLIIPVTTWVSISIKNDFLLPFSATHMELTESSPNGTRMFN